MKTIKTAEAEAPALDWLVAKCEGAVLYKDGPYKGLLHWPQRLSDHPLWSLTAPAYSTDWSQGGPIIEQENIELTLMPCGYPSRIFEKWVAYKGLQDEGSIETSGPTFLIAAMRCFVASKLGETVEVPEELS